MIYIFVSSLSQIASLSHPNFWPCELGSFYQKENRLINKILSALG